MEAGGGLWREAEGERVGGEKREGTAAVTPRLPCPLSPIPYLVYCVIGNPSYMSSMRRICASRL
jgi:hypothetical protein